MHPERFRDNLHNQGFDQSSNTQSKRELSSAMALKQGILEFECVFGETIDAFSDCNKDLDFSRKCETKEKFNALIQLLEANNKIPGWSGGLKLCRNGIGDAGAKDLTIMLEKNTTIHTLNLSSNHIGATGAKDLATMLEMNTTIHTLNLGSNTIGAAGTKDLAIMLETNAIIHTLNLGWNKIGNPGAKDIATMLAINTTIHTINLGDNDIGVAGAKDLSTMLAKNTTICTLDLGDNCIGDAGVKDVATMLEKNTSIRTLNLHHNHIGVAGAKDLATMLENNTTINKLDLYSNEIEAAGAKNLATMLEKNTTITTLDLGSNEIGAAGVKDLAAMLEKNTTIHTLRLGSNEIGAQEAKDLATMLQKNTSIDTLDLSWNKIGDAGVKHFAMMLEKNTTIHTLNLDSNSIGVAGTQDLATMFEKNTSIFVFTLYGNDVGDDGVNCFEEMFNKNVTIQELGFSGKEFSTSIKSALARNEDGRAALHHAVNIRHIQAIELLLEKHHENLDFEKELVVRIWNIVSQNSRIPKQTTLKILVDLAIQSDASDLLHELLPHLDDAVLAWLLPHFGAAAFGQLLVHLDDKTALAQLLPLLDEVALAQLLPHLDDAALTQLQSDPRPEIKSMMEIALTSVDSSFDPSRFAQQLTSLLALPTDVFDEDGAPLPSIFLERASTIISKRRIDLAAGAVRCLLERQHKHEIKTWVDSHPDAHTLMTGLEVTKSAEKHLERYADTPLDLQQTNPSLDSMVVPEWYDEGLVQPAVEAVRNQLEQRRVAALADTTQTDTCQKLAKESLEADRQLYGGTLSKAQQQNRAATNRMELLAAQKEVQIRGTWATSPDTGRPQRPTQPNMSPSATVAQVKLQAVQQGGAFRKVIESMRVATGLTVWMVKGSVDSNSGLVRTLKGGVSNQESSLYMSKGSYRIAQKLWVRGNVRSICDINRAMFVADTFEDLFKASEHVFSRSDIHIVDIKDRVNNPTYGGWSDLVLLFSVEGTSGHIHELQLALRPMMVARGALDAHEAYARARYFVEMLQKCDLQYDSESLELKQHKVIEKLNKVLGDKNQEIEDKVQESRTHTKQIEAQQKIIHNLKNIIGDQKHQIEDQKRPGRALCGWLQQADDEKMKWRRRWFVLSNGWLTYHDTNKVKSSIPILKRINIAKGGMPISICTIDHPNVSEIHKFTITNKSEGTHLHLDASNTHEAPDETHTRKEWVDAMLSHTGCKMG